MGEVETGDYVKTKRIAKVIGRDDDNNILLDTQQIITKMEERKVKHSPNIIDLIEAGDYVNGELVIQVSITFGYIFIETTYYDEIAWEEKHNYIKKEDIKSIVTKEQFSNIEYRLEN